MPHGSIDVNMQSRDENNLQALPRTTPDGSKFPYGISMDPGPVAENIPNPTFTSPDDIKNHRNISESMRELKKKYALSEISIVTDDGLVVATSAERGMEFDAVHYSHVVMLRTIPCEPDVKLFELAYGGSKLIGIIRTRQYVSPALKEQIRDDTKVILQWWL
jgi:hypothetical protein